MSRSRIPSGMDGEGARIKNEQIRIVQLREQIDQELQNNRVLSDELSRRMDAVRNDIARRQDQIESVQDVYQIHLNEKQSVDYDLKEARKLLDHLHSTLQDRQQVLMNDYVSKNKHILGLENDYQREMMHLRSENNQQSQQIHSHWAPKLNSIEEHYNTLLKEQDLLNHKVIKQREMFLRMRIEHDENIKNLESRFYIEEREKYGHQKDMLRKREAQALADMKTEENRRDEMHKDLVRLDTNLGKERDFLENEIQLERERIHKLHEEMSQSNILLDSLRNRNIVLDAYLEKLVSKIEETNRNLIHTKDMGIEDLNDRKHNHEQHYNIFKHSQAMLHQRILELEMMIRSQESSNTRLKSEYDRLSQILINKASQAISEVMVAQQLRQ